MKTMGEGSQTRAEVYFKITAKFKASHHCISMVGSCTFYGSLFLFFSLLPVMVFEEGQLCECQCKDTRPLSSDQWNFLHAVHKIKYTNNALACRLVLF